MHKDACSIQTLIESGNLTQYAGPRSIRWFVVLVLILCCSGCGTKNSIQTEYGKISGQYGTTSLNGVSVFHDLFRERGFTVKRRRKISHRIEEYGTVVWFPDDENCPDEEVVAAINEWMDEGYDRTLIYVGRDYESQVDYLNQIKDEASLEEKEEMMRQMAEAQLSLDRGDYGYNFWYSHNRSDSCEWFELKEVERTKAETVSGTLAKDITLQDSSIEMSRILAPRDYSEEKYVYETNSLLEVNGEPFVFQVSEDYENDGNRIIVVANGSFLLNYPLVDSNSRLLAGRLIDEVDTYSDVLFLESGPEGIEVSDSDITNHNNWAWIAEPPLRYIVPQFLFWGIVFCFVYFPIFGRPKRIKRRNTATFRNHIDATGQLIGRSKHPNKAANKIKKYQDDISGESSRKRKE